jgi:shikimate kinase
MTRAISNLCLAGFMGTGKSTVGRLAAEQLQYPLIDTDAWIQAQTGLPISAIFER